MCVCVCVCVCICIRGVTVHKIHGSVRYDTVVSRFGMFSMQGAGNWLRHNVGNISVLNHEGKPHTSRRLHQGLHTCCECLNLSHFTKSR